MVARYLSWQRSLSVSSRTAMGLALGLAVIIAAMAIWVFEDERQKAIAESLARLDEHNRHIVAEQEQRFDRIARTQTRAVELFHAERAALDDATAQRLFHQLYPRQADGTRRSTDAMFEGGNGPLGVTYGMAAFIPAGIDQDREAVRDIVAAARTVHALGEGSQFDLESLYFFTPGNTIVIFAPRREDRLTYYRKTAPASLNFQQREFARISTAASNPRRVMRCTSLQPLISLIDKKVWTTGCMTPVDRGSRHIGTFGTSMPLHQVISPEHYQRPDGENIVIISRDGRLIHHPAYLRQNSASTRDFLDLTKASQPELKALWKLVRMHGKSGYTGPVDGLGAFASLREMPSAGWYSLAIKPESHISAQALRPVRSIAVTALITLVLSIVIVVLLLRQLVGKPLQKLTQEAQRITDELADDQMIGPPAKSTTHNEVIQLVERFAMMDDAIRRSHHTLEQRVAERTMALNNANAQLRNLSEVDALTGIANRRKILADLDARISRMREDSALAVLLLDVDYFKSINDQHGHIAGDDALRCLAERMQMLLRAGDALGRMGGEEFLIILDRARPVVADAIAERVRAAIANERFEVHGNIALPITVSIGLASWRPGDTIKSLYARADAALYRAKTAGRNCVITGTALATHDRNAA